MPVPSLRSSFTREKLARTARINADLKNQNSDYAGSIRVYPRPSAAQKRLQQLNLIVQRHPTTRNDAGIDTQILPGVLHD